MKQVFPAVGAVLLSATLLLTAPPTVSAYCIIQTADFDGDGRPDIRFLGGNTSHETITLNVGPLSTAVTGCGLKTFDVDFGTYFFALHGGRDTINFNVVGTWARVHKSLQVQTGIGLARLTVAGSGSMTAGSSLVVEVAGMSGADSVAFLVPTMDDSYLESRSVLNPGADSFVVRLDHPITGGSVVQLDADLGGNPNQLTLTQTALVDGTVDVFVQGGVARDVGHFTLGGPVGPAGRLSLRADLGAGNDVFDGFVDLQSLSIAPGGEVRLDLIGGSGADALKVSRKATLGGPLSLVAGLLDVRLDGGTGNDVLGVDLAGGGAILDGTLRFRQDGGFGNDGLTTSVDVQATSLTPSLDVYAHGGSGADRLTAAVIDAGPRQPAHYGPFGTIVLDGGLDANDNCSVSGNGITHERNCEI